MLEGGYYQPLEDAAEPLFCYVEANNIRMGIRTTLTMITDSPGGIKECSLEKCRHIRGSRRVLHVLIHFSSCGGISAILVLFHEVYAGTTAALGSYSMG